jgi:RNA polymerase sigma-70 factor (ECF subfamily)
MSHIVSSWPHKEQMETRITTLMASGDHHEAIRLIVRTWGTQLARYCAGMVGSAAQADELVQDALVEALGAMSRYRGEAGVRAWLMGIARRVCIRHLRKRDRRRSLWSRWSPPETAPPNFADQAADRDALTWALAQLNPKLRVAVLMRHQQGLEGREMAEALGISHAAARKRVSHGVVRLRELLAPVLMRAPDPESTGDDHDDDLPKTPRPYLVGS